MWQQGPRRDAICARTHTHQSDRHFTLKLAIQLTQYDLKATHQYKSKTTLGTKQQRKCYPQWKNHVPGLSALNLKNALPCDGTSTVSRRIGFAWPSGPIGGFRVGSLDVTSVDLWTTWNLWPCKWLGRAAVRDIYEKSGSGLQRVFSYVPIMHANLDNLLQITSASTSDKPHNNPIAQICCQSGNNTRNTPGWTPRQRLGGHRLRHQYYYFPWRAEWEDWVYGESCK